jgi:hypothetical protein
VCKGSEKTKNPYTCYSFLAIGNASSSANNASLRALLKEEYDNIVL